MTSRCVDYKRVKLCDTEETRTFTSPTTTQTDNSKKSNHNSNPITDSVKSSNTNADYKKNSFVDSSLKVDFLKREDVYVKNRLKKRKDASKGKVLDTRLSHRARIRETK